MDKVPASFGDHHFLAAIKRFGAHDFAEHPRLSQGIPTDHRNAGKLQSGGRTFGP